MDTNSPLNTDLIDPYAQFEVRQRDHSFDYPNHKKFNLLEKVVILVCIILLSGVFGFGFLSQIAQNKDAQKIEDISQVLLALEQFYNNSNTIPNLRAYPVSICSQKPNEVDYEYTLNIYLSGQQEKYDSHSYINSADFPNDPWGKYSVRYDQLSVSIRDCPGIFAAENKTPQDNIYNNGRAACNFNNSDPKERIMRNCYLYGSSSNGDSFELAYFSEATNKFVVYSKYRDQPHQIFYS